MKVVIRYTVSVPRAHKPESLSYRQRGSLTSTPPSTQHTVQISDPFADILQRLNDASSDAINLAGFIFHPLPHLLQPINISSMPSLRVSLQRLRSQPCAVSIHPVQKLVHILNLSIFQRMEHLPSPLFLQTQLILVPHLLCCWQDGHSC